MVLQTKITKLFNIKHPIIQGGMHYVGYAGLAAAVANAGGLGLITALTQPTPEALALEIDKAKSLIKPSAQGKLGVNLTILPMFAEVDYSAYKDVIISSGLKAVETAGRPPTDFVKAFQDNGIKVIHKCVTTRHAKSAERMGVDAISLDGFECAGHPGEEDIGNFVLQAQGGRELTVPFVCSGGVGTGKQLASVLMLGASGVNMGTRFMATKEAPIHEGIKKALVETGAGGTTLVMRSVRNTERVFKNDTAIKVRELETEFPGDFSKIHEYVKGENYRKSFQETGDVNSSIWSCGEVMSLIDDCPSCEDLIEGMVKEAEEALKEGPGFIVSKL
ncbi:hypothetical protein TL16_g08600 [Triparma laevis f. inornata]|uniref:Nitronate monooxygenase n=1 Tax=Triparma laevis f. inornata TaxID=1714386 RepID=A0A9W7EJ51_9STRA|nr:hypothetical protein TL16_g08600 [Triparma laevis f. inornata]